MSTRAMNARLALTAALVAALSLAAVMTTAQVAHADTFGKTVGGAKYTVYASWSDDNDDGWWEWELYARYNKPVSKSKSSYTIPKSIKVYYRGKTRTATVSTIASKAFAGCNKMKKIICKANVQEIPKKCFYKCKRLQTASFRGGIQWISDQAFYKCGNLKSFKSTSAITSIGNQAFYGCKNLKSFKSKDYRIDYIEKQAFKGCSKLASIPTLTVTRGDDVVDAYCGIRPNAFDGCKKLKGVTIGCTWSADEECCTVAIEKNAFRNCASLKKVTFTKFGYGAADLIIDDCAFSGCKSLKSLDGINKFRAASIHKNALAKCPLYGKYQSFDKEADDEDWEADEEWDVEYDTEDDYWV